MKPCLYETWRFITLFARTLGWILSWVSWIQSTPSHLLSSFIVILLSHMCQDLPSCRFSSGYLTKILFEFISPICVACPAHLIIQSHVWSVTTDGFWLMTWFIAHFDTVHDYTLQFTITHTLLPTVTSSLPLLGSSFQRRIFHPLGSQTVPGLSYQHLTATAHNN
jgi:hypothetical protein